MDVEVSEAKSEPDFALNVCKAVTKLYRECTTMVCAIPNTYSPSQGLKRVVRLKACKTESELRERCFYGKKCKTQIPEKQLIRTYPKL